MLVLGLVRAASRHVLPSARRRLASYSTPLEREIARSITASGPISFARYMELCLQHPTEGYYARHDSTNEIIGARGDFVTSPEISQHFGQLIAIWFLSLWQDLKPLPKIRVAELGPGRGTLVSDVLKAIRNIPRAKDAVAGVDLVESSGALQEIQRQTLTNEPDVRWWKTMEDIERTDDFTVVIAHEFFDALPFHIIEKTSRGWEEVMVDNVPQEDGLLLQSSTAKSVPKFRRVLSGPSLLAAKLGTVSPRFASVGIETGTRIEVSPKAYDLSKQVAEHISSSSSGGAALFVDYGGDQWFGSSARAFRDHKLVDVFHEPGRTDLTANVDFALLREAAQDKVAFHGPITQAAFLSRMGLAAMLERSLLKAKDEAERAKILKAAGRLVDTGPKGMGRQYQFLGLSTKPRDAEVYPFVAGIQ